MRAGEEMEQNRESLLKELQNAAAADDKEKGNTPGSSLYRKYSLETEEGRRFYESLTDARLLDLLRERARELDHSPSQKETFWVLRDYLKKRFRKWPYALEAAGLKRSCGSGGKTWKQMEEDRENYRKLLGELREEAVKLLRIPHPSDVPELCEKLGHYEKNWSMIVRAAGLDAEFFREHALYRVEDLDQTAMEYLDQIRENAKLCGRAPKKSEVPCEIRKKLMESCHSWRNVLYQIGLEPVEKIRPFSSTYIDYRKKPDSRRHSQALHDCCYRLVDPSEETREALDVLKDMSEKLGRMPEKKEVPGELRSRLTKACGSWTNVLYQLKL